MSTVSVVLPTYNESGNIVRLVEDLLAVLGAQADVIVVDDDSPDSTADRARARFDDDDRVRVIRRTADRGLARAIRCGIEAARGEILVVMDADFNHDPRVVPRLVERLEGADLVVGSRFVRGGGMEDRARLMCSGAFSFLAGTLLGTGATDNLSGFFAARTGFIRGFSPDSIFRGYGDYFFRLLFHAARTGARIDEVPIYYARRTAGESKSRLVPMLARYSLEVLRLAVTRGRDVLPPARARSDLTVGRRRNSS